MTATPATTVDQAIAAMTPAGRHFMRLVGARHFDFFDNGIIAGEGNWGPNMAQQAASEMGKSARSLGGIMARLAAPNLGLWHVVVQDSGTGKVEAWWTLTELGAEVANQLAITDAEPETPAEAFKLEAPATEGKARAHAGCSHDRTKAARAACRREAAKLDKAGAAPVIKADSVTERVATREQELDDAFEDDEVDTLAELDGDAYADAVIADLGGQQ